MESIQIFYTEERCLKTCSGDIKIKKKKLGRVGHEIAWNAKLSGLNAVMLYFQSKFRVVYSNMSSGIVPPIPVISNTPKDLSFPIMR